jgi:hypothetical protein
VSNASSREVHGPLCNPTFEQQGDLPIYVRREETQKLKQAITSSDHASQIQLYSPFKCPQDSLYQLLKKYI